MKIARHFRIAAVAALALTANLGSAQAADVGDLDITGVGPNPLTVVSNGQDYTKLTNLGIFTVATQLSYDTGVAGRIHGWEVTPILTAGYGIASHAPGMAAYAESKSYGFGNRPKSINKNVNLSIPMSAIDDWVVSLCNRLAIDLRDDGLSNNQIFGQDREVKFYASANYDVDASGAGSGSPILEAVGNREVKVKCKKWQGSQIPQGSNDLAPQPKVEHVSLQVQPQPTHNGQCKVKLIGMVRMNLPNVGGKVQLHHNGGDDSELLSFTTAANSIALITRIVEIPKVDGPEIGSFYMHVLPNQGSTNWVPYAMNCSDVGGFKIRPKSPPTGPKTFQAEPRQDVAPLPRLRLKMQTN